MFLKFIEHNSFMVFMSVIIQRLSESNWFTVLERKI